MASKYASILSADLPDSLRLCTPNRTDGSWNSGRLSSAISMRSFNLRLYSMLASLISLKSASVSSKSFKSWSSSGVNVAPVASRSSKALFIRTSGSASSWISSAKASFNSSSVSSSGCWARRRAPSSSIDRLGASSISSKLILSRLSSNPSNSCASIGRSGAISGALAAAVVTLDALASCPI